jgi:predicted ATP-dependent endonuclease of OLD family
LRFLSAQHREKTIKLHAYRLRNYRRLRDVVIELDEKISIFVGANNSGKTSAAQGLYSMLEGKKGKLKLFDFNASLWANIDKIGEAAAGDTEALLGLPAITLDLWFRVGENDLVAAMPLLPSTDWDGKCVGLRVSFEPTSPRELVQRFRELRDKANAAAAADVADGTYKPWPETLAKYLTKELAQEYTFRYYALDEREFEQFKEKSTDYEPLPLVGEKGGFSILQSLLKVDFLRAQRHLDDPDSDSAARAENLSRRLSKFYQRNLDKRADDHAVLKALSTSEKGLNEHLEKVFSDTLQRLSMLGYPGVKNPEIVIRAALDPTTVLGQDAKVHYVLPGDASAQLPDSYNGLGFKNLVYMVVELLDLHERWKADEDKRAPLHLIFIEEPEAHLHAQIQQVFIRNILRLLEEDHEELGFFGTQLVITTHSPHILYERGFAPIRYFRRVSDKLDHYTDVRNLSRFKVDKDDAPAREFLQRYLKLTHCDLFFSDAAILVEGNVERLLMPAMIQSAAKRLRSCALTVLEVGGAFAHRFRELIEFVGLTTLVITDLDSVLVKDEKGDAGADELADNEDELKPFEVDEEDSDTPGTTKKTKKRGSTCHAHTEGAVTSNQTLISWLPQKRSVEELWAVASEKKVMALPSGAGARVRVAYQCRIPVAYGGTTSDLCGRTLEEAFGLENAGWCQDEKNQSVGLRLKTQPQTPEALAKGLHKRVVSTSFDKTRFALEVLASGPEKSWKVPTYIAEGLVWLESEVAHEVDAEATVITGAAAIAPADLGAIMATDVTEEAP